MAKVIVRDLAKKFMWTIVTGDSDSLNRPLTLADTWIRTSWIFSRHTNKTSCRTWR